MDNYGIIQQHMTFRGFNDSERFLDQSQCFKMLESKKNISYVAKIVEKINQ